MDKKHICRARRKLRSATRKVTAGPFQILPRLFYLTDPVRTPDPARTARQLPAGTVIIYRHFGAADRLVVARRLAKIAIRRRLHLLISGDPKLARAVGATGVHWPESYIRQARYWTGHFRLQTISAHSRIAIARAATNGADAALVSTVFASFSPSSGPEMGPVRFRQLARHAALPLIGLGGVNPGNAGAISGVAAIAAIDGIESAFGPNVPVASTP